MPVGGETPVVDASATLSDDGKTLFIGLINRHPESDVEVQLDLGNFKAKPTVQMWQLWSENFTDTNTFEQPEKVKPTEQTISLNEALNLKLPRHSVTVLKFER
jgi:alpha-L-arabinofuranosidase